MVKSFILIVLNHFFGNRKICISSKVVLVFLNETTKCDFQQTIIYNQSDYKWKDERILLESDNVREKVEVKVVLNSITVSSSKFVKLFSVYLWHFTTRLHKILPSLYSHFMLKYLVEVGKTRMCLDPSKHIF